MFGLDDALIAGIGGKIVGGIADNLFANDRQNSAQQFSAQQYATRYQTQVADLKAAGLNPMLAYAQPPGNSPGGVVSTPGNQFSSVADTAINSAQNALLKANARKANAEASITEEVGLDRARAELSQVLSTTALTAAQQANIESQTQNNIASLNNIKAEGVRLVRAAELLYQQANESFARQLTEAQRVGLVQAQAKYYSSQAGLAGLDLDAAAKLENSGAISKQIKPYFDILRGLLRK